MERSIPGFNTSEFNQRFYAQNAKRFNMNAAATEYVAKSTRLREMEELGADILSRPLETLDDDGRDFLERYQALKAEVDDLRSVAATGRHLSEIGQQEEDAAGEDTPAGT